MYLWVKAFHIIAVISWVASLLIYPRYKLHQSKSNPGEPLFEAMRLGAIQLRSIIMIPSLIVTWALGITLVALNPHVFGMKYIWVKIFLVICLTTLHFLFTKIGKAMDEGDHSVSVKTLKILNEAPFVLAIFIVVLIVVKPF